MHPGLRTTYHRRSTVGDLTLLTVATTVESAMSTKTTGPNPVDEQSTPQVPNPSAVDAAPGAPTEPDPTEPAPTGDGLPFECAEFGVEGFLPHLDAASDG